MMQAAVLRKFNTDLSIEERPVPGIGYNDVLVKVRASGLCGTDLHIQEGKIPTVTLPHIPGHETAGEIAALGEGVDDFQVGDHVVIAIDITCGKCRFCLTGRENLCINLKRIGFEIDGGHEEYLSVPRQVVCKIADHVPFEHAAVIPDAVACMYHAIKRQANISAGDKVCILGLGGLGFQGIQLAKLFGAEVYCTSRQNEKLKLAEQHGADAVINTSEVDLHSEIKSITHGDMCDAVLDLIGIETSIQTSVSLCRPGGKAIILGYYSQDFTVNYQNMMMFEKEVIGARGSTRQDLIETIHFVEQGKIKPYVFQTCGLSDINEALGQLKHGHSMGRTVLIF